MCNSVFCLLLVAPFHIGCWDSVSQSTAAVLSLGCPQALILLHWSQVLTPADPNTVGLVVSYVKQLLLLLRECLLLFSRFLTSSYSFSIYIY